MIVVPRKAMTRFILASPHRRELPPARFMPVSSGEAF